MIKKESEMTQNKKKFNYKNLLAAGLISGGLLCMILSSGTEDYRAEVQDANKVAGYEKYPEKDIANEKTTLALGLFGAFMLGAGGLIIANKNKENSR